MSDWTECPHVCPVCHGTGQVPFGFYGEETTTGSPLRVPCRCCAGRGVLWRATRIAYETSASGPGNEYPKGFYTVRLP